MARQISRICLVLWLNFSLFVFCSDLSAEYRATTIKDVITINASPEFKRHDFFVGGAGYFVMPDPGDIDNTAGGSFLWRYTYEGAVSLETDVGFNEFSLSSDKLSGDVFVVPSWVNVLLHLPPIGPVRLYVMGGIGYQLNDSDLKADLNAGSFDGKLVVAPTEAGLTQASNELIAAQATLDNLSSTSSSSSSGTTIDESIEKKAAQEAATVAVIDAESALKASRESQVTPLSQVSLPSGLSKVSVEVKDGLIYTFGAGADWEIVKDFFFKLGSALSSS